ncbi:sensor histidine kinase [Actinospica sp. MGRD01-02]|uniref:histidine kinase n=1 Tax=Actinospica acidithermotolerans TaxID=2828514 RepID=A0A941E5Z3_9ACTN|nr:sensor histidine kinase [Actinospica acidithermotolerans]MBR7825706.1 sensor histidine kinase [Actinospica acidithermotolerans]
MESLTTAAWRRFQDEHPHVIDGTVALLLFGISFPGSVLSSTGHRPPHPWWIGVLVTAVACVALMGRRSHPTAVAAVACASAVVVTLLGFEPTVLLLGPAMFALFTLAYRTNRRIANTVTFTVAVLVAVIAVIVHPHTTVNLTVVAPVAILVLPTAFGTSSRHLRAFLDEARARAEYAERTREEAARNLAAAERVRIARELHDVVAHHLAVANAQAGAVAHLMRGNPEQAHGIATELTKTTSMALRELKATVSLLRQVGEPEDLEPAPGLAQLEALTSALAAAGLAVTVTTEGAERPLPPGTDLTAYRIIQEALTNVTKHGPTRAATVHLAYRPLLLTISILNGDDGVAPVAAAPSSGYGMVSMRERAQSVGGTLRAGPRAGGGFAVVAEIPLHAHPIP